MKLKTKLFAILTILCVLCSAAAVCAADDAGTMSDNDTGVMPNDDVYWDSIFGHDNSIIPPDAAHNEQASHADDMNHNMNETQDDDNGTIVPPDATHNEAAMANQNSHYAAGSDDAANTTANATANAAVESVVDVSHNPLPATGNPLVILLGCMAIFSGAVMLRKK